MKSLIVAMTMAIMALVSIEVKATNLGDLGFVVNLTPVASILTSGDSSATDLNLYKGKCIALLDVSAPVSGDSSTLAVKFKASATQSGDYTDVASGDFTTVTTAASYQKIILDKDKIHRWVKLNRVIGGTLGPNYLMSSKLICEKRRK